MLSKLYFYKTLTSNMLINVWIFMFMQLLNIFKITEIEKKELTLKYARNVQTY